jgi:transposase
MAVIRHGRKTGCGDEPWFADLIARKPAKVAAVARANKNARTVWAMLATCETYRRRAART